MKTGAPPRLAANGCALVSPLEGIVLSIFRPREVEQSPEPATASELLAAAGADYANHNSASTQADARERSGQVRATGNANGGSRWGR